MNEKKLPPLDLPSVELEELYYIEVKCDPEIPVGDVGRGQLNIYPVRSGFFQGKRLRGEVMNLGADWNYYQPDRVDVLDTRYLLKTDDGAYISVTTNGRLVTSREHDDALERGEFPLPEDFEYFYYRQHLFFETGSPKYLWLNGVVAFAVIGMKPTGEICYQAYAVK